MRTPGYRAIADIVEDGLAEAHIFNKARPMLAGDVHNMEACTPSSFKCLLRAGCPFLNGGHDPRYGKQVVDGCESGDHGEVRQGVCEGVEEGQGPAVGRGDRGHGLVA